MWSFRDISRSRHRILENLGFVAVSPFEQGITRCDPSILHFCRPGAHENFQFSPIFARPPVMDLPRYLAFGALWRETAGRGVARCNP